MTSSKPNLFAGIGAFRKAKPEDLKTHVESVRGKVIPAIKEDLRAKERGAQRAKAYKVY